MPCRRSWPSAATPPRSGSAGLRHRAGRRWPPWGRERAPAYPGGDAGSTAQGPMNVVAVVGSQGALPVARDLVAALPEDFPAAVVYVQHRAPAGHSALPALLRYRSHLPVHEVRGGEELCPGAVYVPPAGGQTTL